MKDTLAFAVAAASTVGTLYLIPSWHGFLTDPCLWGHAGAIATVVILLITRHLGDRARLFEVRWLAIFLAAMPLIYVARWLLTGAQGYGWMLVELGGVVAYATFAVAGLKNHWFLAAGITAHGLAWDIWHLFPGSSYIPSWYALGCLIVDIGLGLYAAARIPAWHRAEERRDEERALAASGQPAHSSIAPN